MEGTPGSLTATEARFCGLRVTRSLPSSTRSCPSSRTFNGTRPADRKRLDYIIMRQSHRKLVRNVTVHLQPRTDSDHNIVSTTVRLPGRFARNRKQRARTDRKSIDRRANTSDADRRERLIQLVASQLTQTELGGTVGEKAASWRRRSHSPGSARSQHLGSTPVLEERPGLRYCSWLDRPGTVVLATNQISTRNSLYCINVVALREIYY